MAGVWAAEIAREHARELGRLRLLPGVELGETEASYWVRGTSSIEEAQRALLAIPHAQLYHIDRAGLRPWGHRLVAKSLPDLTFAPLAKAIRPSLPIASYPSAPVPRVPLTLVRSAEVQQSVFLETTLDQWVEYGVSAPKVRLDRWAFAVSAEGRVLVRGQPLPSLPGRQYWESDGVAIPVGWTCSPAITGSALSKHVGRAAGEIVLLDETGSLESIPADAFVQASRSAIRATARATVHHEQ